MSIYYDVAIVGAGMAGSMAAHRLIQKNPDIKIILIDIGRPPGKRRRQIEGFMGCFPNGDGKFYSSDVDKIYEDYEITICEKCLNKKSKTLANKFKKDSEELNKVISTYLDTITKNVEDFNISLLKDLNIKK